MYVDFDLTVTPPAAILREARDMKSFKVTIRGSRGTLAAVAALGRVDGEHVFLDPTVVRALPGAPVDAAWEQDFDAMVAYAASKGWVDDTGAVRAHVERCGT